MARKRKASRWSRRAQLKIRLPEPVRLNLERAARRADRSMNAEMVWRLTESVSGDKDPHAIAAEAILNGLDEEIVTRIEDMILRANFTDEQLERMWAEKRRKAGILIQRDERHTTVLDPITKTHEEHEAGNDEPELFTETPRRQRGKT